MKPLGIHNKSYIIVPEFNQNDVGRETERRGGCSRKRWITRRADKGSENAFRRGGFHKTPSKPVWNTKDMRLKVDHCCRNRRRMNVFRGARDRDVSPNRLAA